YPAVLESDGLAAALRDAAKRTALSTSVHANGTARHARELEAAVYFCCLEAIQNAAKHAGDGARVDVNLEDHDGALAFTVAAGGVGFAANGSGHGLQNMRDRIAALGGTLQIDSAPGTGTTVSGSVPL